jgi:hypothetical protein
VLRALSLAETTGSTRGLQRLEMLEEMAMLRLRVGFGIKLEPAVPAWLRFPERNRLRE